jgi:serine/threonine-protein kinase
LVGRYLVREKLAEGGMAEIYLASASGAEGFVKDVVIKMVHSFLGAEPQFVEMFIAEAKLASRLNHANVVQVFDFGKYGDRYFLAMELVRGVSLTALRRRCRELGSGVPAIVAAEICAQVARGLHFAHGLSEGGRPLGVVHRDVTPHNILLSFDGAVKLSDFGIAKASTSHTAPGILKGKFAYMSPEQARGERVDARSDVFSLGIVLWELLTGGRLFSGDSDVSVLRAVQDRIIPPPTQLNPEVPQSLSDLVMKALARNVEDRYQSAQEMERALATFVLESARTVDDASVVRFVRPMFQRELEREAPDEPAFSIDDDFGDGETDFLDRSQPGAGTVTVTPSVPMPSPKGARSRPFPPREGTVEQRPGLAGSNSARKTSPIEVEPGIEERPPASRSTESMPVLAARAPQLGSPSSRRFARLPPEEPSVVESERDVGLRDLAAAEAEQHALEEAILAVRPRRASGLAVAVGLVALAVTAGVVTWALLPGAAAVDAAVAVSPMVEAAAEVKSPSPVPTTATRTQAEAPAVAAKEPEKRAPDGPTPALVDAPAVGGSGAQVGQLSAPSPAKAPVAATVRAAPVRTGHLIVNVIPFANVSANGKQLRQAFGTETYELRAGVYELEFSHPRRRFRKTVTIRPNEVTRVEFNALETAGDLP